MAQRSRPCRLLALVVLAWAVDPAGTGTAQDIARKPTELGALEDFCDNFFQGRIGQAQLPGAVVAVVQNDQIVFTKGYGFADVDRQTPVMPKRTLFRVASVSKLLTATAALQLVERGRLGLHDDVNRYLHRFQVPAIYPEPVTLAHLLTHTAGFDQRGIGMMARRAEDVIPLGDYLARRLPPRVRPPGQVTCYSNHGMALAGYLVEEVSGVPFGRYVEQNILQPLGMHHSSFAPPAELASDLAVGYVSQAGSRHPVPFDYHHTVADGSLCATAADMARFMIAQLQRGRLGDVHILEEATARQMQRQQYTNHRKLPGWAYAFNERFHKGRRLLEHGGAMIGWSAELFLLPDEGVGFFAACNTMAGVDALQGRLPIEFLDRYYSVPAPPSPPKASAVTKDALGRFAGRYRLNRYSRTTLEKLNGLLVETNVTVAPDGTLATRGQRWVEVEPLVFQSVDGNRFLAFRVDDQQQVTHLLLGPTAWERLAWYETTAFHGTVIACFLLIFLSAVLILPSRWIWRRWRDRHCRRAVRGWQACSFTWWPA